MADTDSDRHADTARYVVVLFDKWDEANIEEVYGPFPSLAKAQTFSRERWPWPGPEFRKVSNQRLIDGSSGGDSVGS